MKKILLGLLIIGIALSMGCNKDDGSATSSNSAAPSAPTPGMPTTPGAPAPSAPTPGMPTTPGAPSPSAPTPGMPTAPGMTPQETPDAQAEATPSTMTKTLEKQFPNATIKRDSKNNEVRVFINPDANVLTEKSKNLNELQSREIALEFIRANYYYFDTMSFEYRPSAGTLKGGVYTYKWVQIIRETKKTGNTIEISVNPKTGKVTKYKSTRQNWDN